MEGRNKDLLVVISSSLSFCSSRRDRGSNADFVFAVYSILGRPWFLFPLHLYVTAFFFWGGGWSSVLLTFQHVRRKHFCLYPLFKVECTWFISAVLISAFMQCGTTSRFPQKINVLVLVWFFNLLALCPKFNTRAQMRESPWDAYRLNSCLFAFYF